MGTIKSLLLNPRGVTIKGWMDLIEHSLIKYTGHYFVSDPAKPEYPLDRLMAGWTGNITSGGQWSFDFNQTDLCVLKRFGINLAKRLLQQNGSAEMEKVQKNLILLQDYYDKECVKGFI
jgi:hypothetical protein